MKNYDMRRPEWERDIRNRQRNIVFPDTVLNQGHFYRTIFRDKKSLPRSHRFGLLLVALPFFVGGCIGFASSLAGFLHSTHEVNKWLTLLMGGGAAAAGCAFGIALMIRALLPASSTPTVRPPRRPRGHIRSRNP